MFFSFLLSSACTPPLPVDDFYDYTLVAEEDSCSDTSQPYYGLGDPVLNWRITDVTENQFDLTLVGFQDEFTIPCLFSGRHFSCVVEPRERAEGWTMNIAAGGAWLSDSEASLYWGMFQECDRGERRCARENTCTIFQQFRLVALQAEP
jgi:hypothetical protein